MQKITWYCVVILCVLSTAISAQHVPRVAVFNTFKQGSRGNCASVAAIKAAINTFGLDSIFVRTQKKSTGYDIYLRDRGELVSITDEELEQARRASDLKPDTSNTTYKKIYQTAILAYAVIAKRRTSSSTNFQKSLKELGEGQVVENVFKWLGLEDYICTKRYMSSISGIRTLVVGGRKHAAFASYGDVDLWGRTKRLHFLDRFWQRVVLHHDPKSPQLKFLAYDRSWNKTVGVCCVSGIDYSPVDNLYHYVSDANALAIQRVKITFSADTIIFEKESGVALEGYGSDAGLESIRLQGDSIFISNETHGDNTTTSVHKMMRNGTNVSNKQEIYIPPAYKTSTLQHNTGIEGLSFSADRRSGYFVAMERPFLKGPDGTAHPVTFVNGKTEKGYNYRVDNFAGDNNRGISEILAYDDHRLLFLERHYDTKKSVVLARIYIGTMLESGDIIKTLLIDLNRLPIPRVDNYEGMTWGPKLSNGNSTLLLISDDNDNTRNGQGTDVIVLEVKE